ncbi:MAG: helix-turn-helix transcriptional regulator [Nocardioidaceae bacterium]|nr:helix-turn-helix transcriptional regulator [Nocardioidaceae bacterium]NUS51929.1 helix-turn-helix transcriptional regulator [Nocardioidaceae bacterium]
MGHAGEGHMAAAELDARTAKTVAATMQALATPSRLLILGRLRSGTATVGELSDEVGMEQSAVSHQLRLLRNLGLVEGERQGRSIVYRLYDDHVAELLDQAVFHSEHLRLGLVDRLDRQVDVPEGVSSR